MPGAPPAKRPGAFNAHSPGDGGNGLVQPVFRSPARIPTAESSRRGLYDAPPSEKRSTLSRINRRARERVLVEDDPPAEQSHRWQRTLIGIGGHLAVPPLT